MTRADPPPSSLDEDIRIEIATEVTDELVEAWERLLPQLSSSARPLSRVELDEIVFSDVVTLFMARFGETYVGSLSLVVFRIPDGVRAWVESVIVDESARGKGIGARLNEAAIARAQELGARSIDLTSRPAREAANRLYRRLGFVQRETNVYRFQG